MNNIYRIGRVSLTSWLLHNRTTACYQRNACVIASATLIKCYRLLLQIICFYTAFLARVSSRFSTRSYHLAYHLNRLMSVITPILYACSENKIYVFLYLYRILIKGSYRVIVSSRDKLNLEIWLNDFMFCNE